MLEKAESKDYLVYRRKQNSLLCSPLGVGMGKEVEGVARTSNGAASCVEGVEEVGEGTRRWGRLMKERGIGVRVMCS